MSAYIGSGNATANAAPQTAAGNDVTITVNNVQLGGWQEAHISAGCERMPRSFELVCTEKYPGATSDVAIPVGSPCTIAIGGTPIITGFVDRAAPQISAGSHVIRVQGRGRCEDIVDCSAPGTDLSPDGIAGSMYTVTDLVQLATKLCKPFGINVISRLGPTIPMTIAGQNFPVPIMIVFGESPYEVIERVARYIQVLIYEDAQGNLILGRAGSEGNAASGFVQGVNVQDAGGMVAMDERFSVYQPAFLSYQQYGQGAEALIPPVYDKTVPRFRPLYVVSEQVIAGNSLAQARAEWEMKRRWGRSQAFRVVCDSWRDAQGNLWTPNTVAPVAMPALKMVSQNWVIGDVTFHRDAARGTVAELVLMPPQAYALEPQILAPFGWYNPDGSGGNAGAGAGHPVDNA